MSKMYGIFISSLFYFVVYTAVCKGRPVICPSCVLPGLGVGCMWAIAQLCFSVANQQLQIEVSLRPEFNPARAFLPAKPLCSVFVFGVWEVISDLLNLDVRGVVIVQVAYPVVTTLPGLISSMWGIWYFQEIKGRANYIKLGLGFVCSITGTILIALSRDTAVRL